LADLFDKFRRSLSNNTIAETGSELHRTFKDSQSKAMKQWTGEVNWCSYFFVFLSQVEVTAVLGRENLANKWENCNCHLFFVMILVLASSFKLQTGKGRFFGQCLLLL